MVVQVDGATAIPVSIVSIQSMSVNMNEKEAVEKVLRRAEISRITRHLKSRLALASFKAKRGWEDLALDSLEQELTSNTGSSSNNNNSNNSSSSINGSGGAGNIGIPADTGSKYNSPDKAAFFYTNFSSPNHQSSRDMLEPPVELTRKRARTVSGPMAKPPVPPSPASLARAGRAAASIQTNGNGSEPASASSSNTRHGREMSSPDPPKTPPRTDKDGANLLMYLATSPSPAQRTTFGSNRLPRTPQQSFNFADYLNIVTPSPAAGHRSPINTPRGARRRLFED